MCSWFAQIINWHFLKLGLLCEDLQAARHKVQVADVITDLNDIPTSILLVTCQCDGLWVMLIYQIIHFAGRYIKLLFLRMKLHHHVDQDDKLYLMKREVRRKLIAKEENCSVCCFRLWQMAEARRIDSIPLWTWRPTQWLKLFFACSGMSSKVHVSFLPVLHQQNFRISLILVA